MTDMMTLEEIDDIAATCDSDALNAWFKDGDPLMRLIATARLAVTRIPGLELIAKLNKIHVERIAELEAENERMRAALTRIQDWQTEWARDQASEALQPKQKNG